MYTEMVSAKALLYKNRNTKPLLETRPEERAGCGAAVWLRSGDYERDGAAAGGRTVCHHRRVNIRVVRCQKIVNNGEGSAPMKDPKLAEQILTAMVKETS